MIKYFDEIKFSFRLWFKMLNKARFSILALIVLSLILVINMTSFTGIGQYLINTTSLPSTTSTTSSTDIVPISHLSIAFAYICVFTASILWGAFLLPVKHYDTGDGIFFQFVMCVSIWFTGIFVNFIRQFPKLYGLTVIGGVCKNIY
jgi:hypothetical protein